MGGLGGEWISVKRQNSTKVFQNLSETVKVSSAIGWKAEEE